MAYKQELWDEAKKKCRIGDEEIRTAKEMGLNPKSLIKNMEELIMSTQYTEEFKKDAVTYWKDYYELKEIARLKKELRDTQDALDISKKAIGILGKP